jgi:hypothetical protein
LAQAPSTIATTMQLINLAPGIRMRSRVIPRILT